MTAVMHIHETHAGAAADWIVAAPDPWWVLHTRARNEKRVAAALTERGVLHYLPLVTVRRTYAKCTTASELPLFPGYVFLCGGREACLQAQKTNRVAQVLPVADQAQLRAELTQVYRVVASGKAVDLVLAIPLGTRCRIKAGPLHDLEGVVVQQGRQYRMHLSVTILGQSAVVEVDAALLEPLN